MIDISHPVIVKWLHDVMYYWELGSKDLNLKFHVQSVTCCHYTTPQDGAYFTIDSFIFGLETTYTPWQFFFGDSWNTSQHIKKSLSSSVGGFQRGLGVILKSNSLAFFETRLF